MTGGDGFVGRHLVAHLLGAGDEVSATTLTPVEGARLEDAARHRGPRSAALARASWHRVDLLEPASLRAALDAARPQRIFHLAGFASGARARERPGLAMRVNVEGTLNLVSALDALEGGPRTVIAGTGDVYGDPPGTDPAAPPGTDPVSETCRAREDDPFLPRGPYAVSKALQELVARGFGKPGSRDVRVARLFPLIGPGQDRAFVVPGFCAQAAAIAGGRMEPVLEVGNLNAERDFTDVRDGVRGMVAISELEGAAGRAYNVCSGRGLAVRRILHWILEAAGIRPEIRVDPARLRPGEPRRRVGSPARLFEAAGWRAERDVQETVRETYAWERDLVDA